MIMNQAYIHLLVTHLPIFGSVLGGLVLLYGLWTKSNPTKIAAYSLFIISAIGAGIAYLTGEGAEEAVEHIQGINKNIIEEHEDFAMFSLISLMILGVVSAAAFFLTQKKSAFTKSASLLVLFISFISFGIAAKTGHLGGQIRHTEINSNAPIQEQGEENDSD
jgi:uncharacterized membrane protein